LFREMYILVFAKEKKEWLSYYLIGYGRVWPYF
jgi:hypothetical protein